MHSTAASNCHDGDVPSLVETADGWTLGQGNRHVTQLQLDFRFGLLLDDGSLIILNGPFILHSEDSRTLVDGEPGEAFSPALSLLHRDLVEAIAHTDGRLSLTFSDGVRLEAMPDDHYENWEAHLSDGAQLIGVPGGGVTVFPPNASTSLDGRANKWSGTDESSSTT